jgi:hypothetical protein
MAKQVMPPAELPRHDSDIELPTLLFPKISLFAQLKQTPSLERFPGAYRLRFYRHGEIICRHGEAGWSAFYLLTDRDVAELRGFPRRRLEQLPGEVEKAEAALARARAGGVAKEIDKAQAAVTGLRREMETLFAIRDVVERQLVPPPMPVVPEQLRAGAVSGLEAAARACTEPALRPRLAAAPTAGAAANRALADHLEPQDAALASVLRDLARADDGLDRAAIVRLPRSGKRAEGTGGALSRLGRLLFGSRGKGRAGRAFIPNDGPRDLDARSRLASLYEGELFGEVSCLYRTPRSATVVAARDGYVLEFMRHILDQVQKDAAYRARVEAGLRQRLVNNTLRQFSILQGLTDDPLSRLAERVEFVECAPGSLLFDEHEPSDAMYIIGGGILKIVKGVSWLLPADAAIDGTTLRAELVEQPALAGLLPLDAGSLVQGLNGLLKDPRLHLTISFQATLRSAGLAQKVWSFLARPLMSTPAQMERCNRLLVESVDPLAFPVGKGEAGGLFRV